MKLPVVRPLPTDRCAVMGIVNVTPDSFSDGGRWATTEAAVARGMSLWGDGADVIDVGGESTRPGAATVAERVEIDRVVPVVESLCAAGVRVSVDTTRAAVAERAIAVGASIVNDVSGGLVDGQMLALVARTGVQCVLMHWRGPSTEMDRLAVYDDVVVDVVHELRIRLDAAVAAGVRRDRIILDPGLGFAKSPQHNWELLHRIDALHALGQRVLIGASRKRFLGELLADSEGAERAVGLRDGATAAVTALAAWGGAWGVRVHDVKASADAVRVVARWRAGPPA